MQGAKPDKKSIHKWVKKLKETYSKTNIMGKIIFWLGFPIICILLILFIITWYIIGY